MGRVGRAAAPIHILQAQVAFYPCNIPYIFSLKQLSSSTFYHKLIGAHLIHNNSVCKDLRGKYLDIQAQFFQINERLVSLKQELNRQNACLEDLRNATSILVPKTSLKIESFRPMFAAISQPQRPIHSLKVGCF